MLRVGTDCSGIEAPIQALRLLNIPYIHCFSSEIDKYCIESIKANYEPEILYGDPKGPYPDGNITTRDHSTLPDIDLYVCGFPCQPFSLAGSYRGFNDHRGNVFWACIDVIESKRPKYFILENVAGLLHHDKGNTWSVIWNSLEKLENYGYTVKWKLLNTKDYGIPQNRERLYIIGVKNSSFDWPDRLPMDRLDLYIDYSDTTKYPSDRLNMEIDQNLKFIDLNFHRVSPHRNTSISPCLNTHSGLWCVTLSRYANIRERLNLQGFPEDFKQVVSNTQMLKQIGNSMSVNVLSEIYASILQI